MESFNVVSVKNYAEPPINYKEILRYSGMKESATEIENLINECLNELNGKLDYRVCFTTLPLKMGNVVDFTTFSVNSKSLQKTLNGYDRVILFVATVGLEIDRLIKKYSVISPTKAVIFQAIGAERIEELCNAFENDIKQTYQTSKRFSCGYGDFDILYQKEIFKVLNPQKLIGVTLLDSMLMLPSKSVSAVIGVK